MTKLPITDERRQNGPVSFGSDVRKIVAPILGKSGFIQADLLARWPDVVGQALAQGVFPASIRFPTGKKQEAVLQVKAVSGAFAMELTANSAQIIDRINAFFGYPAIADLRVIQGAIPPKPKKTKAPPPSPEKRQKIEKLTESVEDSDLRTALTDLGIALPDKK